MGRSMAQFVGSYNSQREEIATSHRRAIEAKKASADQHRLFLARKSEIETLVATIFWRVPRHMQRSLANMNKAYDTAKNLARVGGEDYAEAVKSLTKSLKWRQTIRELPVDTPRWERDLACEYAREAYADACAVSLINVND